MKNKSKRKDITPTQEHRGRGYNPNRVYSTVDKRNMSPPSSYETKSDKYTPFEASIEHIYDVTRKNDSGKLVQKSTARKEKVS